MPDTISYTSLLLTLVTGVAVAAMVYLMVVLNRVNRLAAKLDDLLGNAEELFRSLKVMVDETTATMVAARHLIEESSCVATDMAALSARIRGLSEAGPGPGTSLVDRVKATIAVLAGIRSAYSVLQHFLHRRRQSAADNINN